MSNGNYFLEQPHRDNYSRYLVLRLMLTRYRYDVLRVIASGGSSPAASHRLPVAGNAA
jgi:hypothetical protein